MNYFYIPAIFGKYSLKKHSIYYSIKMNNLEIKYTLKRE